MYGSENHASSCQDPTTCMSYVRALSSKEMKGTHLTRATLRDIAIEDLIINLRDIEEDLKTHIWL